MKIKSALLIILCMPLLFGSCKQSYKKKKNKKIASTQITPCDHKDSLNISLSGIKGYYKGVEFNEEGDIAHQFSNKVAKQAGIFLKEQYQKGNYLKIDFSRTKITTKGLDLIDTVHYTIEMPFIKTTKCQGFTGIEHCGTWDNQNGQLLKERLNDLKKSLETIKIGKSDQHYFRTEENFKEYWVQFKHKDYQKECE